MAENDNKRLVAMLYQQGVTLPVIAQMVSLTEAEVTELAEASTRERYLPLMRKHGSGAHKQTPTVAARNAAICEAYANRKGNTVSLGKLYGISRERVAQILRKQNLIEMRVERNKLAREMIAEDKAAEKAALLVRFKQGEALVAAGKSIHTAAVEINIAPAIFQNWLQRHSKVKSLHGRWRDFQPRIDRYLALRKKGYTMAGAIKQMNAEGDKIHSTWVYQNGLHTLVPDEHKYQGRKKGKHHAKKGKGSR